MIDARRRALTGTRSGPRRPPVTLQAPVTLHAAVTTFRSAAALLGLLSLVACSGGAEAPTQTEGRSAAVKPAKRTGAVNDTGGFCELAHPASGAEARGFAWPVEQALPDGSTPSAKLATDRWTYVNVWATWCRPCVEEFGLLARWDAALQKEGRPIDLQMLSIDKVEDKDALARRLATGLPGHARWLRSEEDFGPFLDALGVDRTAAIPIHALVDPQGHLRCVRVGAISPQDYAAVKSILAGG